MVDNILPALAIFAVAASITPGPNNIMVMASGANFGLVRSLPHLFGISAGVFAIISLIGLGLMTVFDTFPVLQTALRVVSALYLLWLAWKIAIAVPPEAKARGAQPLTFFQSATFQGVNPKIWATGFSAITLFAADRMLTSVILVAMAFAVIGLASNAIWTGLGTALRHWLSGVRLRAFNIAMALLLVGSLYPVLFP
ncbi:LysE family translocator [Pseudomonas sp. Q11]|uniref:LysE family translocator n=1 Tax=Pseudomonas sp. Q11 TaxID=2968470 RepID=UPI0021088B58|nr:LysE family translocator [Pseudomonas sp. Q11]MCQ6255349.1 LysE family translocator [Pseudomonas sp. Q11]